jgi:hypothetical protein
MRRVKGRRLSKRSRTRCATEIDASSARVTNRWKASRTRESTVLQWCGGTSGLDRPDRCFARSSAWRRPEGDEASDPSSSLIARSREHSVRQLDPLAEVSPSPLKREARWQTRLFAGKRATGCRVHGCSSLTMWVASVGRTRPGSPLEAVHPKRAAAGEPARGEPRHLRLRCRGARRATRRAKLSTSRGQPGGQVRAAKKHFAASEHD